jgi:CrcB protein
MTLSREAGLISPELRLLLVTGLLGGFTTFSAFSYETFGQLTGQNPALGVLNILLNVGVGLAAAWGGIAVGRAV